MKFRTEIELNKHSDTFSHSNNFFLVGSCFTENIGNKLSLAGFEVLQNPFGIHFNPYSIANCIYRILDKKYYVAHDFMLHNNKYINFDLHGKYSETDVNTSLNKINESINRAHHFTKNVDCIIITLGTAWVYEYQNKIVANCHKLEQTKFIKRILTLEEIVKQYQGLIIKLQQINKDVRIIFTLSPVRHLRDGFVENQLSKALLHVVIHELIKLCKRVEYFPSYEIQMDDLRDYRFCKEDMLHPTEQAVEYVWKKFSSCYFSDETVRLIEEFNNLYRLKNHKVISHETSEYQKHNDKINELEKMLANKIKSINT